MEIKCRCCLTSKKGAYYSLLSVIPGFGSMGSSLLDILRIVSSSPVTFSDDLPTEICAACLRNLKIAFEFIILFKNSEIFLQKTFELMKVEDEEELETIIITGDENDDILEETVIFTEDEENMETNFEHVFGSEEDNKTNQFEHIEQLFDDGEQINTANNVREEHLIKAEPFDNGTETNCENSDAAQHDSDYFDEEFKQELLEMEKNREKNKNNVTIMTIDDVLKVEKRKVSEKKVVLSVEDVMNVEKNYQTPDVYTCDICNRIFNTRKNLKIHKYGMHNPNWKEKFKCSICDKECRTLSSLRHHMLKHDDRKYICHLCGKQYVVKQHLTRHIKSRHENSQKKYLCPLCGKHFRSNSALTYHLRIHNNQRNYMCRYCGFKSLALGAMKRHERIHTGERPYDCRFCDKSFAGSAERQKHENVHKGIMPYKCQYCDKRFVQTYNLKVHLLQHTGDNVCSLCNKGFIDEDTLKFHYQHRHKVVLEEDGNLDGESE